MEYYIFDVRVEENGPHKRPGKVTRMIKIAGSRTLYRFARAITKAFGFYFDHPFGFYDTFGNLRDAKKAFELFVDIGEEPIPPSAQGVEKTKVSAAFTVVGEKMMFLFDYGDEWRFTVELKEIRIAEKGESEPIVLESLGKAPEQYPIPEQEKRFYEDS